MCLQGHIECNLAQNPILDAFYAFPFVSAKTLPNLYIHVASPTGALLISPANATYTEYGDSGRIPPGSHIQVKMQISSNKRINMFSVILSTR